MHFFNSISLCKNLTYGSVGIVSVGFVRIFLDPTFVVISAKGNEIRNDSVDIEFDQPKGECIGCYVACNKNYVGGISNFFRKEKFFNKLLVKECLDDENTECFMISISENMH